MSLQSQRAECRGERLELVQRLRKAENRYSKRQNPTANEEIVDRRLEFDSEETRLQRPLLKRHENSTYTNEDDGQSKYRAWSRGPRILFSQEIIDQFIDHLQDSTAALKACALVCRAWVHQSRMHLFRLIHILPPVLKDQGIFSSLSKLLEHPLCTFASSVRELSIFDPYQQVMRALGLRVYSSWIDLVIAQLDRLVSLNTLDLTLSDEHAMEYCDTVISKAPSFTAQLTHLTLWVCHLASQDAVQWMAMIHSFQSLIHLKLIQDDYEYDRYGEDVNIHLPTITAVPPTSLRVLRITSWETEGIMPVIQLMLQWLRKSETRLSTLEFGFISMESASDINTITLEPFLEYLRFLGPSLETLTLKFDGPPSMRAFLHSFEVEQNPQIQVLRLEYPLALEPDTEKASIQTLYQIPFLFAFLSKISSPYLTTIICELRGMVKWARDLAVQGQEDSALDNETSRAWPALDNLLTGRVFPVLSVVDFQIVDSCCDDVHMMSEIETGLPQCKKRELLHTSMTNCGPHVLDNVFYM